MDDHENVERIHPLTPAQKGLLYQTLFDGGDALYRTQARDDVWGEDFDAPTLRAALQRLVDRHEALRTLFLHAGLDEPAAVVRRRAPLPWREHDLSALDEAAWPDRLDAIARESLGAPLPLDEAPLYRVTLVRLSAERSHVIHDIHHLIFDGWSSRVFFAELQVIYGALRDGVEPELPPAGRFGDHAIRLSRRDATGADRPWRERLAGFERPTSLQLDRPVPVDPDAGAHTDASFRDALDAPTARALKELARTARITLATLVEAAWALTLARYNDTDDVVVGVTLNGRGDCMEEHGRTFGMFAAALPLRLKCAPRTALLAWLEAAGREKARLTGAEHASMAEIHLASELPAGVPLFEALLVFQTFPSIDAPASPALRFTTASVHENNPFPLLIDVFDDGALGFLVMHDGRRLPAAAARQLVGHYLAVLGSLAGLASPGTARLSDVAMLGESDRRTLLGAWAFGARTPVGAAPVETGPPETAPTSAEPEGAARETLHGLFLQRAERTPGAVAVIDGDVSIDYASLAASARRVRDHLVARGVGRGEAVALCLGRSAAMYPALLGTLLAGARFVPIDPAYPAARRARMLGDCGARLALVDGDAGARDAWGEVEPLGIEALLASAPPTAAGAPRPGRGTGADDANADEGADPGAYVMYTSGSTGLAQGVVGGHAATINRCRWMWRAWPFAPGEVACQKTSSSFVDSIWEIFGPLLAGVPTVVVPDPVVEDAHALVGLLERERVSRIVLLPSHLAVVLDGVADLASRLAALRVCTVSGEPLPAGVAARFRELVPRCELLNLYGSTEVSGDVTAMAVRELDGALDASPIVPIGRPVDGCRVYVLDATREPMPPGATGEIAVAGRGLALGYHGDDPDRGRFVPDPFGGGRLYLTGDLGRFRGDGTLEHRGRKDAQVKIRGRRIEPAEIERAMAGFDGVRAALVNAPGGDALHGYYRVNEGATVDPVALEGHLRERLPDWMVPRPLMPLERFPRLPNGKVSRRDLPAPDGGAAAVRVAPRTATERRVAELWAEALGTGEPSAFDNFVAAGGSSLTGMRFNARLHREYGRSIPPRMLLSATLSQIAAHLAPDDVAPEAPVRRDVDRMEPMYFGEAGERLFGVLHLPRAATGASAPGRPAAGEPAAHAPRAALLCPSIGHEYMRLHRAHHLLATELARRGFHVLRFDWSGVGDAEGESSEASMARWERDARTAAALLRARSGAAAIDVVAVRLGAPIVLGAAIPAVARTVLWDPVCAGADYLAHLDRLHDHALGNLDRFRFRQRRSDPFERFGYTYSERLGEEVMAIDPRAALERLTAELHVVTTSHVAATDDMRVSTALARPGASHRHVPEVDLWFDAEQASYLAFVQPVLDAILEILEG